MPPSSKEKRMSKGTRLILVMSLVTGALTAVLPPLGYALTCTVEREAWKWLTDDAEIQQLLRHEAKSEQMSGRAHARMLETPGAFFSGTATEPECPILDRAENWALRGSAVFVLLFIGAHGCWLIACLYNKAMNRVAQ
jgi:hypothetical protein